MAISDKCCGIWPQRTLAITIFSGQRPYHLKFTETLFVCVDRYCLLWPEATAVEKLQNVDNLFNQTAIDMSQNEDNLVSSIL